MIANNMGVKEVSKFISSGPEQFKYLGMVQVGLSLTSRICLAAEQTV